jgi:hypothetical protein
MGSVIKAVCFDFNGVIFHHETKTCLPGIDLLLLNLQSQGIHLGLASRIPADIVSEKLGPLKPLFAGHVFSGGGEGKLTCVTQFAKVVGIEHLHRMAFVDDKPDNLLPVALKSDVKVIGFKGSGKYPEALGVCEDHGLAYASDLDELEALLLKLCKA